jgi:hypothetical protein
VTGHIVAGQIVADKSLRTIRRMDNSSQDKSLQDKTSRTNRRGHFVADSSLQKKCRTDISSHGQNVAWTIRCKDKSSQDKTLQHCMVHGIYASATIFVKSNGKE